MTVRALRLTSSWTRTMATLLLALCLVVGAPLPGVACCVVDVVDRPVRIAGQEVLILWDSATGTEHFIRRANFQSGQTAKSFGFLVPTPTKPDLAESPDAVFDNLAGLLAPEEITRYDIHWSLLAALLPSRSTRHADEVAGTVPAVRVVSRAHVACYDAVVLEADDPAALTGWLAEHGFDSRPELADWARPYVEAHWMVTAFTYNPDPVADRSGNVATAAVRMTFTTEDPVFPYRVPSDNRNGGSLLRLYYVGDERATAQLGPSEWTAPTTFARRLGKPLNRALSGALPNAGTLRGAHWLTVFEDATWPAGKDDLYFGPDVTQASIFPSPIVHDRDLLLPLDALLIFGAPFLLRARKRTSK